MVKQERELRAMIAGEGLEVITFGKTPGHYKIRLKDPVSSKEFNFHAALTPSDRRNMLNSRRSLRNQLRGLRG